MKKIWWILLAVTAVRAQFGSTIFDIPVHARAAGMGESFVAVANDAYGPYFNPATIASLKGMNFAAGYDPQNYLLSRQAELVSFAGVFSGGYLGNIGVFYTEQNINHDNRFVNPGFDTLYTYSVKNRIFGVSTGAPVTKHLSLGFSFKSFAGKYDNLKEIGTGLPAPITIRDQTGSYMDIGVLYGREFRVKPYSRQQISMGSSYSNINLGLAFQNGRQVEASRIWRTGAAYRLYYRSPENVWRSILSTFSLEWRQIVNQTVSDRSIYALGWEGTFAQVVSLRTGSIYRPMKTDFSSAGTWQFHWGAGLDVPLHLLLKTQTAIVLTFDYARMSVSGVSGLDHSDLFSLQLAWLPPARQPGSPGEEPYP